MTDVTSEEFKKTVWDYYYKNSRDFPWRKTRDPYKILVSEIMLQQTQTDRVVPKYTSFIAAFPTVQALAQSPITLVLKLWSGLGYNRRALYLHKAAQMIDAANGEFPTSENDLIKLPGVGKYTAGAIMAFAYNKRAIFIETNIRRTFIHFFFHDGEKIPDNQLIPLIEQTLPQGNYREWYYALMDYGAFLAKTVPNPNRRSKHYIKQSKFEGSRRQLRGKILRLYLAEGKITENHMVLREYEKTYIREVLDDLQKEGLIDPDLVGID